LFFIFLKISLFCRIFAGSNNRWKRQDIYTVDSSLDIGDPCTMPDGAEGVCVHNSACPSAVQDFKNRIRPVQFCAFNNGAVLCCKKELERTSSCMEYYKSNKEKSSFYKNIPSEGRPVQPGEFGYFARIGLKAPLWKW
jgi:hypothetical protein